MAVTTAAAFVAMVMVMMASTTTTTLASTIASAAHTVYHSLDFLVGSLAVFQDLTLEVQGLSSQWVVQVYLDLLLANFHDFPIKAVPVLVLQGDDGIRVDVLMVEMTVDTENLTVQFYYMVQVIIAIRLFLCQRELEILALRHVCQFLFKGIQCETETTDEVERLPGWCLFHQLPAIVSVYIQTVAYGNVFIRIIAPSLFNFIIWLRRYEFILK